jgi:hypothetical protein
MSHSFNQIDSLNFQRPIPEKRWLSPIKWSFKTETKLFPLLRHLISTTGGNDAMTFSLYNASLVFPCLGRCIPDRAYTHCKWRACESPIYVWFWFMYSQKWNCEGPRYFQNRFFVMFCLPISTFMYLWAIYIFPGSVCLFCCSQIGRPILGIYK